MLVIHLQAGSLEVHSAHSAPFTHKPGILERLPSVLLTHVQAGSPEEDFACLHQLGTWRRCRGCRPAHRGVWTC